MRPIGCTCTWLNLLSTVKWKNSSGSTSSSSLFVRWVGTAVFFLQSQLNENILVCFSASKLVLPFPVLNNLFISRYVFCYTCLHKHISQHGRCPITELPASTRQMVRIFASDGSWMTPAQRSIVAYKCTKMCGWHSQLGCVPSSTRARGWIPQQPRFCLWLCGSKQRSLMSHSVCLIPGGLTGCYFLVSGLDNLTRGMCVLWLQDKKGMANAPICLWCVQWSVRAWSRVHLTSVWWKQLMTLLATQPLGHRVECHSYSLEQLYLQSVRPWSVLALYCGGATEVFRLKLVTDVLELSAPCSGFLLPSFLPSMCSSLEESLHLCDMLCAFTCQSSWHGGGPHMQVPCL